MIFNSFHADTSRQIPALRITLFLITTKDKIKRNTIIRDIQLMAQSFNCVMGRVSHISVQT